LMPPVRVSSFSPGFAWPPSPVRVTLDTIVPTRAGRPAGPWPARSVPPVVVEVSMRRILLAALALAFLPEALRAEDKSKPAPKVVLQSPDGKKSYDLAQLTRAGPVLVRLTCTCSGCDQELPYFQKLQAA